MTVSTPDSTFGATTTVITYNPGTPTQTGVIAGQRTVDPITKESVITTDGITFAGHVVEDEFFEDLPRGNWAMLQLVTLNRVKFRGWPWGNASVTYNNVLDAKFPYGAQYAADLSSQTRFTDTGDSDSPESNFIAFMYKYSIADTFNSYMMYCPPDIGNGSEWVPLRVLGWGWTVGGQIPNGSQSFVPDPPNGTYNVGTSVQCSTFPTWTNVFTDKE